MNKKTMCLLGAIFLFIVIILGIFIYKSNSTDGAKFKREYEAYNNKSNAKGSKYQALNIPKKNKIKYISMDEAVDIAKSNTALIYFGYPNCPWCRGILPALIKKTNESDLKNLYYVDMTDQRDVYSIDEDGKLKKDKDASASYYELLKIFDEYLDDYIVKDEDGIEHPTNEKRIYVPLVVAIEDGIVKDTHVGSVGLEEDQSPYDKLNETQNSEIEAIFQRMIDSIEDGLQVCDEYC